VAADRWAALVPPTRDVSRALRAAQRLATGPDDLTF